MSRPRTWCRAAVSLLLLLLFAWLARKYAGSLPELLAVPPYYLLASGLVFLVTKYYNGEVFRVALGALDCRVSRRESFCLVMVMGYTNLFVPHAGIGTPAVYLKARHGLQFSRFSSLLLPATVMQFIVAGLVGLIALFLLPITVGAPLSVPLVGLFALVAAANTVLLVMPIPSPPSSLQGRWGQAWHRLREGCDKMRSDRGLMFRVFWLQTVILFLRTVRMWISFRALGVDAGLLESLVLGTLAQFAMLVSITPGALGFREAAILYGHHLVQTSPDRALAVAVLDRAAMMAVNLVVGMLAAWALVHRTSGAEPEGLPPDHGVREEGASSPGTGVEVTPGASEPKHPEGRNS